MARTQWEKDNNFNRDTDIIVMGYTVEEKNRQNHFNQSEKNKGYKLECPLIDADWDKNETFAKDFDEWFDNLPDDAIINVIDCHE